MTIVRAIRNRVPGPTDFALFFQRRSLGDDPATLSTLPDGFGDGEFALELLIRPTVVGGAIDSGSTVSIKNDRWSSNNVTPYSASDWWTLGNFLLDGHNNTNGTSNHLGTFDLQLYNTGRVRWLFGDGSAAQARTGGLHAVQGGDSLLDGAWHRIVCVRRWDGGTGATLELWVDGTMVDSETTTARTNMASTYWDSWSGFPVNERNWMFGVEKISALGGNPWEKYMGLLDEVRFYNRAPSSGELSGQNITSGRVARYACNEGSGTSVADSDGGASMVLTNTGWSVT